MRFPETCLADTARVVGVMALVGAFITPAMAQDLGIPVAESVAEDETSSLIPAEDDLAALTGPPEAEKPFVELPVATLAANSCESVANRFDALARSQFDQLPASPSAASTVVAEELCTGSAWRLSRGDGISNPKVAVAFNPTTALCEDGSCRGRQWRSRIELGLDQLAADSDGAQGWFLFAGADDKAVLWRPGARNDLADGDMVLNDSVTVGDVEAGVSLVRDRTEWSVSYIHRETSYRLDEEQKLSDTEGYVGVVFRVK